MPVRELAKVGRQCVQSTRYWSATTRADDPTTAWIVDFSVDGVFFNFKTNTDIHAWCVRGPMQESVY